MKSFFSSGLSWSHGFRMSLGQGVSFESCVDYAEPLLVFEDALAQLLVAIVEQVHRADLVYPLLGRMVRRVRAPGAYLMKIGLEGLVWCIRVM